MQDVDGIGGHAPGEVFAGSGGGEVSDGDGDDSGGVVKVVVGVEADGGGLGCN